MLIIISENINERQGKLVTDKRKEKRFKTKLMVKIHAGILKTWGVVSDISNNGIFVNSTHKHSPDAILDMQLIMPNGKTAWIKGVVKRLTMTPDANRKFGIGVEIIEKDTAYKSYLASITEKKEMPFVI